MKTIFYDLKRVKVYLVSFVILSFIMISFFWRRDISNYNVGVFSYYFFSMNYLGMLYIISRLYIDDFQTGAVKNLYVHLGSIGKVIKQRQFSSIVICLVFFLISQINVIISYNKLGKAFQVIDFFQSSLNMMIIYLMVGVMIASYVGLVACLSSNYKRAYIGAILPPALLHYFLPFILFLTKTSSDSYLRKALEYFPSGLIIKWVDMWKVSITQSMAFVFWVTIFILLTIIIYNHKGLSD